MQRNPVKYKKKQRVDRFDNVVLKCTSIISENGRSDIVTLGNLTRQSIIPMTHAYPHPPSGDVSSSYPEFIIFEISLH